MKKSFIKDKSLRYSVEYMAIVNEGVLKKFTHIKKTNKDGFRIELIFAPICRKDEITISIRHRDVIISNRRDKTFPLVKETLKENNIPYERIICLSGSKPEYSYEERLKLPKEKQKHLY